MRLTMMLLSVPVCITLCLIALSTTYTTVEYSAEMSITVYTDGVPSTVKLDTISGEFDYDLGAWNDHTFDYGGPAQQFRVSPGTILTDEWFHLDDGRLFNQMSFRQPAVGDERGTDIIVRTIYTRTI